MKLVEENVNNQLKEKYGEKIARMQRSDEAVYVEHFSYVCF
jgi:translation initiation factor 3 subunit L